MTNVITTQVSTSISSPIGPIDRGLDDAMRASLNNIEWGDGELRTSILPSPELRGRFLARLSAVRNALIPLQRDEAEKRRAVGAVAAMLSGWMTAKAADPAAKANAYMQLLRDLPSWVVVKVCAAVARGHVEGLDPDFPPSAARLHQLGEAALADLRKEAADLHRVTSTQLIHEPSPEERARIVKGFAELSAKIKPSGGGDPDHRRRVDISNRTIASNEAEIEAEWRSLGLEPMRHNDRPISVALARLMRLQPAPQEQEIVV